MADQIVAVASTSETARYELPESTRLSLLSPAAQRRHKRAALIEQQRNAFVQRYGDPFGQTSQNH